MTNSAIPVAAEAARHAEPPHVRVEALNAYFGSIHAVRDASVQFRDRSVTAVIQTAR